MGLGLGPGFARAVEMDATYRGSQEVESFLFPPLGMIRRRKPATIPENGAS